MSGPVETEEVGPHDELVEQLTETLPEWLPTQRWFGGKDRDVSAVRALSWTPLLDGDPLLLHVVVEVEQADRAERYQLLVGSRQHQVPDVPASASIGVEAGFTCYEATGDADLTSCLLDSIAGGVQIGHLRFEAEPDAELDTGLRAHPITTEQSNTSLVYGRQYILKLFRKLTPGVNKDLLLHRALWKLGSPHIAEPLGAISGEIDGEEFTFGMLQRFMPDAADGWVMASTSVRDLMADGSGLPPEELGGDFAGEAYRLGKAVANVHADLARALGSQEAHAAELEGSSAAMIERLDRIAAEVPELGPHVERLRSAFRKVADLPSPITVQSVHGDLHLGQVLRTVQGWLLLDFEGEPAATLAERTALRSPLRDVAGMLRSFDYAAHQLLVGQPHDEEQEERALSWARRNRSAFCDGYGKASGADPREQADLLLALELDKAVYEVAYEHANRPDWLTVPLSSIARMLSEGE
ncbi:aminoglycoside phosphotransferase [Aeromicrobium phragmitis]|uniref:Maltokinase n=1 Tax=Aeromicrobium phragmitis TaxID=2478914 RepID=A0A3L8PTK4_9ACTN|nr:aminoglycoside phosphotransferase [Aeromicrobium phragmitis]RLV57352.1 aminoglycoside phosphotransferase [Aeromicrobium phragmitis]